MIIIRFVNLTLINGKTTEFYTYQDAGDKYLDCIFNLLISRYIPQFLVFYDILSGVRA